MEEKAAVYCRLSQDDGSVGESGSIQTQRTLLTQYCKEQHISIADYYCDDGWSGTNFERPEFQRMLEDIESGKVNTVIVKDLSRFGREYAQMGMYIEHYFEQKNVRFISVAESIDSAKGLDNLVLPFTNVINSFYARQASTKTRAAHQARARSGMFMGSRAPFGYQKDPDDRHHLIVDPPAADVVRDIFRMFADGIGYVRMTKILREREFSIRRPTSTKIIRITIRATTGASPLTGTPAPSAPSSRTRCIWERWFSAAARQRASSTNGVWKRTSPSGS